MKGIQINRLMMLIVFSTLIALTLCVKLAYLQIIRHSYYAEIAQKEHTGYTELPARRGEILTKDFHSGETFKLATNISLDLLYADPTLIKHREQVAETLTPLLFDLESEQENDKKRVEKEWNLSDTEEKKNAVKAASDEELLENFKKRLTELLSQEIRDQILLNNNITDEIQKLIINLNLNGIRVDGGKLTAYPKEITNNEETAKKLSGVLDINEKELERILLGKNRYIVLKQKLAPEISIKIREILEKDSTGIYRGIGLKENFYRFYPENTLTAQVLGFVDFTNNGQYGIESFFNTYLKGKEGVFVSKKDASGQQITVGESTIRPAIDGNNVTITIDRSIQLEVEKRLEEAVKNYQADAGQVVIMEPKTGRILAMAHSPTFNPNEFSKIFEKKEIYLTEEEIKNLIPIDKEQEDPTNYWLYLNTETNQRIEIFKEKKESGEIIYKMYKNTVGPKVYRNSIVNDLYEPGSVFKVVTMASAIDAKEVRPSTTMYEGGPIKVDEYEIHNSTDSYEGNITMTHVLEKSSNIGISFVAKKLGRNLFYNYITNFGFGKRTDIEFDNEESGKIEFYTQWAESELYTHGFGQGISATPIQMLTAIAVIANDGLLMQPYIVESVENGSEKVIENKPKIIQSVITKETADIVSSMLVSAVENGVARRAQVPNHYVAGKTGTSQTYKHGKALKGIGTTITSFAGFAPIDDPKFVILIKFDHPRSSPWGDSTAAPLFSQIAEYLFQYFNIPPDKNV